MFDIHNHVLPRVDDGANNTIIALRMLEQAVAQGITHVCCTPHANDRSTDLTNEHFQMAFAKLKDAVAVGGLPVELGLAAELMIGTDLQRVLAYPFATYNGKGEYFLLEFQRDLSHEVILNVLKTVRQWGKKPVIAHVERYSRVVASPERPEELRREGAILSMDAGSLFGQFGSVIQKRARALLQLDVIDILTSDAHNDEHHGFCLDKSLPIAASIVGEARAREMVNDNPRRVWFGEPWPEETS